MKEILVVLIVAVFSYSLYAYIKIRLLDELLYEKFKKAKPSVQDVIVVYVSVFSAVVAIIAGYASYHIFFFLHNLYISIRF